MITHVVTAPEKPDLPGNWQSDASDASDKRTFRTPLKSQSETFNASEPAIAGPGAEVLHRNEYRPTLGRSPQFVG
ncbi:hypothetical protein [Brevundimonas sp.]|uniref:hypothetical protein n=1 Tax=Brevundimonas sp. TaxID=1871086 RepID=UPI0028A11C00|nr:hypothetical protein [Brevundimonas sp.]